jgi:hypothetical protein
MPYLPDHKLLFIHIPKCGGTSIEESFGMCHTENFWYDRWDRDRVGFVEKYANLIDEKWIDFEPQHYPAEVLKKLIPDYDQYFRFSFVRHPYTKMLSEYFYSENKMLTDPSDFDPAHFDFWCRVKLTDFKGSHFEPQVNFICNTMDFVGRYEQMEKDFIRLLELLLHKGVCLPETIPAKLQRINHTGAGKELLLPMLWRKTKKLIYRTYKQDFKQFGYDR